MRFKFRPDPELPSWMVMAIDWNNGFMDGLHSARDAGEGPRRVLVVLEASGTWLMLVCCAS